jgi:hypothetical protein
VTTGVCLLGVLLHVYTVLFKSDGGAPDLAGVLFLISLLLWSCLPYVIWASVAVWRNQPKPAFGAAIGMLAFDCYTYYCVFIAPTGSTAALALLFAPLLNLVMIGPLSGAVSWPLLHFATKGRQNAR